MSGVMEIFDKYRPQNKDAKVSLSGDVRDWAWFRIHAFTNTKINLIKGLQILNNLLAKHEGNSYEEFLVCLEEFPIPSEPSFSFISREKKSEAMSFNLMVNFWTTVNENCLDCDRRQNVHFTLFQ